jgi:hypothetical protein
MAALLVRLSLAACEPTHGALGEHVDEEGDIAEPGQVLCRGIRAAWDVVAGLVLFAKDRLPRFGGEWIRRMEIAAARIPQLATGSPIN